MTGETNGRRSQMLKTGFAESKSRMCTLVVKGGSTYSVLKVAKWIPFVEKLYMIYIDKLLVIIVIYHGLYTLVTT